MWFELTEPPQTPMFWRLLPKMVIPKHIFYLCIANGADHKYLGLLLSIFYQLHTLISVSMLLTYPAVTMYIYMTMLIDTYEILGNLIDGSC